MDCSDNFADLVYDISILTRNHIFFYILFREYMTDSEK